MSNGETQAGILAEMRDPENDYITNNDLRDLADRLEAAEKRERGALVAEAETATTPSSARRARH